MGLGSQDRMMKELHSQGTTIEDIARVLKNIPLHPRIVPSIKAIRALGYAFFFFKVYELPILESESFHVCS